MDLRTLPDGLTSYERTEERRRLIEKELGIDLSATQIDEIKIGSAEEKNCEQMFGAVPVPVGYAGPLSVTFGSQESTTVHLPLATTEGALVASVNRGCKACSLSNGVRTSSEKIGITRSIAFKIKNPEFMSNAVSSLNKKSDEWKKIGEETSGHLRILRFRIDETIDHLFLTLFCDTDEAMGMNMVTIAAQEIGKWIEKNVDGITLITVAGNVDSDKKPSRRTHDEGRGFTVHAEVTLHEKVIENVLKSSSQKLLDVAHAKLELGSPLAGALGANLHAANIVVALYLATGQDAAHVAEGSLCDTKVEKVPSGLRISVRAPAIIAGIRGGGTVLPAQAQCLALLLQPETSLHPCVQLAESIGAGILAGEISLLAAQATHALASSHKNLAR